MLASYFVLEHVATPAAFLNECHRVLRDEGICIIEVPDIRIYPQNPVAFWLYEHVNHFSQASLAELARQCGFECIESGNAKCSRPYGFAAVFRKFHGKPAGQDGAFSEVTFSSDILKQTVIRLGSYANDIELSRRRLQSGHAAGITCVVWGANDVCLDLLDGFDLPSSALVVDSDPAKACFLGDRAVATPKAVSDRLAACALFVICTRRHAGAIMNDVQSIIGRPSAAEVLVLDVSE